MTHPDAAATPAKEPSPDGRRLLAIALVSIAFLAISLCIVGLPILFAPFPCPLDEHGRPITSCVSPCLGPDGKFYQGYYVNPP